jgi:lipopolysaccharide export system ATP-binding protein
MEGLIAQGLVKRFRNRVVVDRVSVDIQRGEVVGLLGPNGAGKTTSFYMMVGLLRPEGGRIFLEGQEITDLPMYQRCRMGMGYLPQESSVFRKLTVEENLLAILETMDLTEQERMARLRVLLAELDLTPLARHKAFTLSGGERRRLEITRALVTGPSPARRALHRHRSHRHRGHPGDRGPPARARHRRSHHRPQRAGDPRHHRPSVHPVPRPDPRRRHRE